MRLQEILHVPNMQFNLCSGSIIMKKDLLETMSNHSGVNIKRQKDNKVVLKAVFEGKKLVLNAEICENPVNESAHDAAGSGQVACQECEENRHQSIALSTRPHRRGASQEKGGRDYRNST